MLQSSAHRSAADRSAADVATEQPARSYSRRRQSSRPTVLVVHSRSHAIRFRIVTAPAFPLPADMPVSFPLPGHRMCQKAMDCNVDETSDRNQR